MEESVTIIQSMSLMNNSVRVMNSKLNYSLPYVILMLEVLYKNLNEFEIYFHLLSCQFSIIGITETWLKDENSTLYMGLLVVLL